MIRQRARQFFSHNVTPGPAERTLAEHYLDGPMLELFFAQEPRDVVHSANTARWLLDRGHEDRALIVAALMHDIGKGEQRRRDRVLHVLTGAAGLNEAVADEHSSLALRRAIHRSRIHGPSGAATLAGLGVDPRVVELVKKHHEPAGGDAMLKLLQEADAAT